MRELDLVAKVRELAKYLDEEAIAVALKLTPEAVRDILEGRAEIREVPSSDYGAPVIQVGSVKTAYRQKLVAVARAKGGVGATVTAIGLAWALSCEIRTLLVDLNFFEGAGDLAYYLNLPDYPHLGLFRGDNLEECVVGVESDLFVLQPPRSAEVRPERVGEVIAQARQDYDAVVFDLPNRADAWALQVLRQCTTIVAVTGGAQPELVRLAVLLARCRKETVVVANRCRLPREAPDAFPGARVVEVGHDAGLDRAFERGELPSEKGVFMRAMVEVREALFDREKKSALRGLFRLKGGAANV